MKLINRQAGFRYQLLDRVEAGLVLTGSEVKSLRLGKANLSDAYAVFRRGELYLVNCHISPYDPAGHANHEPTRTRKLLLHARELDRLAVKLKERGFTLVPTQLYLTERGHFKCELALAKGKDVRDKRETIKAREAARQMRRVVKR